MLCLPSTVVLATTFSISHHDSAFASLSVKLTVIGVGSGAQTEDPPLSPPGTIRLDKSVLDHAAAVMLGDQALRDCRREWEWDRNGQVPNTFPVLEEDTEKEAK